MIRLPQDFKEFLLLLNGHRVEYLLESKQARGRPAQRSERPRKPPLKLYMMGFGRRLRRRFSTPPLSKQIPLPPFFKGGI
jgi:hypothetical protein